MMFIPKFNSLLSILEFTNQTVGWGAINKNGPSLIDYNTTSGIPRPKIFKTERLRERGGDEGCI
jgi:hypothetical protein